MSLSDKSSSNYSVDINKILTYVHITSHVCCFLGISDIRSHKKVVFCYIIFKGNFIITKTFADNIKGTAKYHFCQNVNEMSKTMGVFMDLLLLFLPSITYKVCYTHMKEAFVIHETRGEGKGLTHIRDSSTEACLTKPLSVMAT